MKTPSNNTIVRFWAQKQLTPQDRRMRLLVFLVPCGALLAAIFGRVIYLQASAAVLCVLSAALGTKRNILCRTCCAKHPRTA